MFIAKSRSVIALLVSTIVPIMSAVAQENHVVPLTELHRDAAAATESRQGDLAKVERFFSSEIAQNALRAAHIDGDQIKTALPMLSSEELAQLAARTSQLQADFAAGSLSNQEITYILIALGTAVIILVIVAAR